MFIKRGKRVLINNMCGLKLIDSHVKDNCNTEIELDYDYLIENAEEIEVINDDI